MSSQIIIHVCFGNKPKRYKIQWLLHTSNAANLAVRDHGDLIFLSICSLGFCIRLCHLACYKFIFFLSFWCLLNAGWHQHQSYAKQILRVICQCIIKSNTLCVISYLKQTKVDLYIETKNCCTGKSVYSHFFTDLAEIWLRMFRDRCPSKVLFQSFNFYLVWKLGLCQRIPQVFKYQTLEWYKKKTKWSLTETCFRRTSCDEPYPILITLPW